MLLFRQTYHQLVLFLRRPEAVFFVMALPLVMFLVFVVLFGNERVPGTEITTAQFYAPALAVFGAVMACYTSLAISTAASRDLGVLKRIRGTPLRPWIYIWARILAMTLIAIAAVIVVMAVGNAFFDVRLYPEKLPMALLALFVGCLSFAGLGMMVCALCRTSDTVQVVTAATLLPLSFLSDVFIRPFREVPFWISWIADVFPLKHFAVAFGHAFRSDMTGDGFVWFGPEDAYVALPHVAIMLAWGVVASIVAARLFKWDPGGEA